MNTHIYDSYYNTGLHNNIQSILLLWPVNVFNIDIYVCIIIIIVSMVYSQILYAYVHIPNGITKSPLLSSIVTIVRVSILLIFINPFFNIHSNF